MIFVQVPGVRLQTLGMLAPQVSPLGQPAQLTVPPQLLPTVPQYLPLAVVQLSGVQAPESGFAPQTLGIPPPPHVCPPAQAAQFS